MTGDSWTTFVFGVSYFLHYRNTSLFDRTDGIHNFLATLHSD